MNDMLQPNAQYLTPEDIGFAYLKLPPEQKVIIDDLAKKLVVGVKTRNQGKVQVQFSEMNALEVLAKTGIWIIENDATHNGKPL